MRDMLRMFILKHMRARSYESYLESRVALLESMNRELIAENRRLSK